MAEKILGRPQRFWETEVHHKFVLVFSIAAAHCAIAAGADDLAATSWRLVEIQSMDGSVDVPEEVSQYTLEFMADGTAALQAECNRGTGSWTSDSASDLRFGPIASTRALCPPGSLSERYLAQFERVRTYLFGDGRLFLATNADGSILEFEPSAGAEAAATVLGEDVNASDAGELREAILSRLFDQYAAEQGLEAEAVEIDTYLDILRSGKAAEDLTADQYLSPEEAIEVEAMETAMAARLIRQWKINKSLYGRYGGRIIY
jgi:heat shock protein HslJ